MCYFFLSLGLEILPLVCGTSQHFQGPGHRFSPYGSASQQITYVSQKSSSRKIYRQQAKYQVLLLSMTLNWRNQLAARNLQHQLLTSGNNDLGKDEQGVVNATSQGPKSDNPQMKQVGQCDKWALQLLLYFTQLTKQLKQLNPQEIQWL